MPTHDDRITSHLTDEQLYSAVHAGGSASTAAAVALRRRHWARVSAFALTVVDDTAAARHITGLAFDRLLRERPAAAPLGRPPRLFLLLEVSRAAALLTRRCDRDVGDRGAAPVAPPVPAESAPADDHSFHALIAKGFAALPPRTQALLWHSLVEREPDDEVAPMTGDRPETLAGLVSRALVSCHDASLHLHLDTRPTPWCSGFGRMLDAAATREDVRRNPHLTRHLGECPGCTTALRGLMALRETPRSVLAEAVLGSAPGAAYAVTATVPGDGAPSPTTTAPPSPRSPAERARGTTGGTRNPAVPCAIGVVTVLLAAGALVTVTRPAGTPSAVGAQAPGATRSGTGATPAQGASSAGAPPSASAPPSPTRSPSASVAPGGSPAGPPTSPAPQATASPDAPTTPLRASAFVPAVNSDTGLCLDVRGGVFANGTDVITTTCRDGSATQRWRLDDDGLLRNGARTDYCLDSRGAEDRNVGIWSCSAHARRNGENLEFALDTTGRIRPRVAPDLAVTPAGASGAVARLRPADGSANQYWNEPAD
ncbi:RICIN domain-containing protein [Streptomyces sp. WAC08241]|uniref:RICIN domain-containing protein n=1 Tax=Streptomyces sp. WAC08241 TaxID=2487421 RepID=UPI000F771307|nr:RICIN domain-containing protein [Streptomyces sp. WAC08241]RSS37150.1 hypothetical protein EF906_23740 [Streptomyces sp. WAC08241]